MKHLLSLALAGWVGLYGVFRPAEAAFSVKSAREQLVIGDRWLAERLRTVLPELMRREKIDMWLVICREYAEDPVYLSLVPSITLSAQHLSMLVFFDRGAEGIERLVVSPNGFEPLYRRVWDEERRDPWALLARVVEERQPRRIGVDVSADTSFGDGLSASLHDKLKIVLGAKWASRLVSAQKLAVGWLERRTPDEVAAYTDVVSLTHQIIALAFSRALIIRDRTTAGDVAWWMYDYIQKVGLRNSFYPYVDVQRPGYTPRREENPVIRGGDLLHCDVGLVYLKLRSDVQQLAYVLKEGETDAPQGLKDALAKGNRAQDILTGEFAVGRSGYDMWASARAKAAAEGLQALIYSHPIGIHGHGAGPFIGLWTPPEGPIPGAAYFSLFPDTCFAVELSVRVPVAEWNGQIVRIALEEDAIFGASGISYLDGRQTQLLLVK